MGNWYQNNQRLFREERRALAAIAPLLRFAVVAPGFKINDAIFVESERLIAHGTHGVRVPETDRDIEYAIAIVFPNNYPKHPPILFCNDPILPIGVIDRHIMKNGSACLGVRAEINNLWRSNPTIVNFIENMVEPFLVWQAHFDAFHKAPPWGERSHFGEGILEFYAELLGMPTGANTVDFMKLLARKNKPKGHEHCPCGSAKRLRDCHRDLVYDARDKVYWKDVEIDLAVLESRRKP